jgi:alpha-N-acetylglucosamine transferase
MTKKTFRFTKRLLMVLSVSLCLALVLVLQMNLEGVTHV